MIHVFTQHLVELAQFNTSIIIVCLETFVQNTDSVDLFLTSAD